MFPNKFSGIFVAEKMFCSSLTPVATQSPRSPGYKVGSHRDVLYALARERREESLGTRLVDTGKRASEEH